MFVWFEVVVKIRTPCFCFTQSPVEALRVCYDWAEENIETHGGSLERQSRPNMSIRLII